MGSMFKAISIVVTSLVMILIYPCLALHAEFNHLKMIFQNDNPWFKSLLLQDLFYTQYTVSGTPLMTTIFIIFIPLFLVSSVSSYATLPPPLSIMLITTSIVVLPISTL